VDITKCMPGIKTFRKVATDTFMAYLILL